MFSLRGKNRKKASKDVGPPPVQTSPVLPEVGSQNVSWPVDLVDPSEIPADFPHTPYQGGRRLSIHSPGKVSFHRPFRSPPKTDPAGGPISLRFANTPPSAFPRSAAANRQRSTRKQRAPPTFNLMVVGGQGTGKTSLLRLILETADVSPSATHDQRAVLEQFLRGGVKPTDTIKSACVEIVESESDRVLLSVVDTPGLDFRERRELKLERQVSEIMNYLNALYAETMGEESKVIRQSKGDQHIHLCIYVIDPAAVIPQTSARPRSGATVTAKRMSADVSFTSSSAADTTEERDTAGSDDEGAPEKRLAMSPVEIAVIKRLAARVNVLPVVGHADTLSDDALRAVKAAVSRDLSAAGWDFGMFGPARKPKTSLAQAAEIEENAPVEESADGHSNGHAAPPSPSADTHSPGAPVEGDDGGPERNARPVVKLRGKRSLGRTRHASRSRSRLRRLSAAEEDDVFVSDDDEDDPDSVANVRFSAHAVARAMVDGDAELLPFALIMPEHRVGPRRGAPVPDPTTPRTKVLKLQSQTEEPDAASANGHGNGNPDGNGNGNAHDAFTPQTPEVPLPPVPAPAPAATNGKPAYKFLQHPEVENLRGVFVRKFRWGTVDVLDPAHCDFAALRVAVLGTHMKRLKTRTKEVLYEGYRTEKLLSRRVTRGIGIEQTNRLLEDLGLNKSDTELDSRISSYLHRELVL